MAEYTFPNQKVIHINREPAKKDFLGIKNENWQAASRDLGATALRLYLYLASNADGYNLALSPVAIQNAIGMPRSTYQDQFKVLVKKGYLVPGSGNTFEFFEVPQTPIGKEKETVLLAAVQNFEELPAANIGKPETVQNTPGEVIEINNITSTDNGVINNKSTSTDEEMYIPKVKEVVIQRPVATGRKRPSYIGDEKREEFIW